MADEPDAPDPPGIPPPAASPDPVTQSSVVHATFGEAETRKGRKKDKAPKDKSPVGPRRELPDDCPVTPIGVQGTKIWYLDARQQLVSAGATGHGVIPLIMLFGGNDRFLRAHWPRYGKATTDENGKAQKGPVIGFKGVDVAATLIRVANAIGVVDPSEQLDGVGVWKSAAGGLVVHCGHQVGRFHNGAAHDSFDVWGKPGALDGRLYPAFAAMPPPSQAAAGQPLIGEGKQGAGHQLLAFFKRWYWRRPDVDPVLLLGLTGCMYLAGALEARPLAWLTGDTGTGKSVLFEALDLMFGAWLTKTSDTTAAGLWTKLGASARPIAIEEIEANENPERTKAVIKLAREAVTGNVTLRGSADLQGSKFECRSVFLFSSILIPAMPPQDLNRLAILELERIPKDAPPLHLDGAWLREIGAAIFRRVLEAWPNWRRNLETFRAELGALGHDKRTQTQFGSMLAMAWSLLNDSEVDPLAAKAWAEKIDRQQGDADTIAGRAAVLDYLMGKVVQPTRDSRPRSLADWIEEGATDAGRRAAVDDTLQLYGMRYFVKDQQLYVAIANRHQELARLFNTPQPSRWASPPDLAGPWGQDLRRIEGVLSGRDVPPQRIGRVPCRCVAVPWTLCVAAAGENPDNRDPLSWAVEASPTLSDTF